MSTHVLIYQGFTALAAGSCAGLALWLRQRHEGVGVRLFIGVFLSLAAWCLSAFAIGWFWGTPLARAAFRARHVGVTGLVVFFFLVALWYTDREQYITPWSITLLLVYPVAVNVTVWAPSLREAFVRFGPPDPASYTGYTLQFEPGFLLHLAYAYVFISVFFGMLLRFTYTTERFYRKQSVAIIAGSVPPVAADMLFVSGVTTMDYTPVAFTITAVAAWWALAREGLAEIAPVAKETVVTEMDDAVLILDGENRLVDYNPAAASLFRIQNGRGRPAGEVFAPFEDTAEQYADVRRTDEEITIVNEGVTRHFQLSISPLGERSRTREGRVVVLRDITELKRREEEIDLMRQVQSRVLRHNIRNDLQVVKTNNQMIAEELDGKYAQMATETLETANSLLATSQKARASEQLVENDQTPTTIDLAAKLRDIVDTYRTQHPDVEFDLECPEEHAVETIPAMTFAFENLIENAVEHNDSPDPAVRMTLADAGDATTVTVRDNGPGIPEHELSVLEQGQETPLEHGSGVGLWIVQWVVDSTTASVAYETDTDGTEITVRIPG